jgi:hypothetical protein
MLPSLCVVCFPDGCSKCTPAFCIVTRSFVADAWLISVQKLKNGDPVIFVLTAPHPWIDRQVARLLLPQAHSQGRVAQRNRLWL